MIYKSQRKVIPKNQEGYVFEAFEYELDTDCADNKVLVKCHCYRIDDESSDSMYVKTNEYEYVQDYVRYHLHYSDEYAPKRIQKLVDEGTIVDYLNSLVNSVDNALESQRIRLMENSKELKAAALTDPKTYDGLVNMYALQAREIVFQNMVYR